MNKISENQELENKFRGWVKSNPENSLNITREKDWYKKKIIEMVSQIENEKYIKMIYGYVNSAYREKRSED